MTERTRWEHLQALSWQRQLTTAEEAEVQAWLAHHPEQRAEWESDQALNAALLALPAPPVASNFTFRVMESIALESAAQQRVAERPRWSWQLVSRWLPRAAIATLVLSAGLFSFRIVQTQGNRAQLVHSLVTVSEVAPVPSPEILNDYDAIAAMGQHTQPQADVELLHLLQ